MSLPESLLDHLSAIVPGFAGERQDDQWALARMLWACAEGGREHRVWPDMFSFSTGKVREFWGDDARMRRVVGFRYFTVYQGSNLTKVTSAYAPSIYMAEALVRTLTTTRPAHWVDESGTAWNPAGNVIASHASPSKTGKGNRQTKWKGAKPVKFVPINIEGLTSYRRELLAAWRDRRLVAKAADWVRRQTRSIDVALMMARNARWPGTFPIKYREGSTGRLSAQGHSLQSMPGLVRSAALAGYWDYDISTCQWTILSQMARRFGIECPLTDAYIADKGLVRHRVSEGAQISLKDAKQCLTALLFGAVVQHSEAAMRFHPGDLVKAIGASAARRLNAQPDFMALYQEIGRVGDAIVKAWPRSNGRLFNDLRIQFETGSQLAHLLQGAEAAALRAVVTQQQGNILLCVHDGWVTSRCVAVDDLAAHIFAETGYLLRIEPSRMEAPGPDRIKRKLDEFETFSEGELRFACPFSVAQGERVGGGVCGSVDRPVAGSAASSECLAGVTADELSFWTSHPHPEEPVIGRLAFVSSRPAWNLPPGSTANYVGMK